MSDYKKEILTEFRKKFTDKWSNGIAVVYPVKEGVSNIIPAEDLESFLSLALTRVEEAERERIAKAMQPAFDDFNAAAQTMIKSVDIRLERTGTEIIENIGYMKSVLLSPSEEKECACYCHYPATAIHPSDFRICPHCSPQKEKRGR